ncbi:MAG: sRNA-binding carbon storage regulator CsrA [Pseudohongiellaceae bacterium]|jgi:sRNA-binding carbon storage regulator CsrA
MIENGHFVLTRKSNEALCFFITDSDGSTTEFTLTLEQIRSDQANLSIDAPANVLMLREELLETVTS